MIELQLARIRTPFWQKQKYYFSIRASVDPWPADLACTLYDIKTLDRIWASCCFRMPPKGFKSKEFPPDCFELKAHLGPPKQKCNLSWETHYWVGKMIAPHTIKITTPEQTLLVLEDDDINDFLDALESLQNGYRTSHTGTITGTSKTG